ncbi:hypothetical protein FRC03_007435 [Tulasnella sp. 419]|nr:hypothetical protein FRC03_007435 [Tulasnella sp. 419]
MFSKSSTDAKARDDTSKAEIRQLQSTIASLEARLEKAQLEKIRQDTELESLRKFSSVYDTSHASDVTDIINSVNNLTAQLAGDISQEWTIPDEKGPSVPDQKSIDYIKQFVPHKLVDALAACDPRHPRARLLLQYSMQAYTQCTVQWITKNFCYGTESEFDRNIKDISRRIREHESQATYGRWRSLTHRHIQDNVQYIQSSRSKHVINAAPHDFHLLGCFLTGHSLTEPKLKEVIEDTEEVMKEIVAKMVKFATMTRQQIISANFSIYQPRAGDYFRHSRHELPIALEDDADNDLVLATICSGTRKFEKVGREHIEGSKVNWVVHDKPQVITARVLHELLKIGDPAPTRRHIARKSQDTPPSTNTEDL